MKVPATRFANFRNELFARYGRDRFMNAHADVLIDMDVDLYKSLFPRGLQNASRQSLYCVLLLTALQLIREDQSSGISRNSVGLEAIRNTHWELLPYEWY